MLQSADFSVIVQGPVHSSPQREGSRDLTVRCLASIRRFLPGAEIVLSTWQNTDTNGLDYDVLLKSEDPGAVAYTDAQPPIGFNNLNRQIVSTRAGLEAASRLYAIKFRGDLFFESGNLLNHATALAEALPRRLFHSRVIISPFHTRNPRKDFPLAFVYSDIFQIGRTEDLRKLWTVPLAPEPETTRWLELHPPAPWFPTRGEFKGRVYPEQYMVLAFLSSQGNEIRFDHPYDLSPAKLLLSERVLLENFKVLDLAQIGAVFPERILQSPPEAFFYQNHDWERLSRAYAKTPTRWLAQADLLLRAYGRLILGGIWWIFFRGLPRLFKSRRAKRFS